MNRCRQTVFVLIATLAFLCTPLLGQPVDESAAVKSPVALFRELLAMTPAQREEAIANRPAGTQKRILEKLNEYELLPEELRNLRLRETELRWYLRPLMDEPRTNRAASMVRIPEELRDEVQQRLELWDLLPPPLQEQFRNDDLIASYFAQARSATPQQLADLMRIIPPAEREKLQKGLDGWGAMSESARQSALAGFNKFFELTPQEKEKALNLISEEERVQMEQTLTAYEHLTPEQRKQCISSFEKFAQMSIAERQQFLKNAERWRDMTPEERAKWRQLVSVAPIIPAAILPNPPSSGGGSLRSTVASPTN
jgi:hypothetical protein